MRKRLRQLVITNARIRKQPSEHTSFKKVDSRPIPPNIKVLLQHPSLLHPQLREIESAIVANQQQTTWFEHLLGPVLISLAA
jgi:hypothetical protein